MQRVLTLGKELSVINQLLIQEGLILVDDLPEVIVTHGGDGYLLQAERDYPGLPKLPIRYHSICKTCVDHDTTHAIKALARGAISQTRLHKLETEWRGQTFLALNEFSLHHVKPNQAIRFTVQINDEPHIEQAIGDGLIIATSFGSYAYYRSITKSTFRLGIGLAYNNTTEPIDHMVVRETDRIVLKVTRGPAYLLIDNDPTLRQLAADQSIIIRQSSQTAILLGIEQFRCPGCDEPAVT